MNRSARLIAALALGAIVLLAALPAWLGWRAERTYRTLLDGLATTAGVPAPAHRYQRGWLGSEIETELRIADTTLWVRLHVDHGPLAGEGLAPVMAYVRGEVRMAAPALATVPALTLEGATGLDGVTHLTLTSPAARLPTNSGEFTWGVLRANLRHERDTRRLQAQFELPSLRHDGEHAWHVDHLRLQLNLHPGKDGVPLGEAELSAASLVLADDEHVDEPRLTLTTRAEADGIALTAEAQLRAWQRHGTDAGPGRLAFTAQRLEPAAMWPLLRRAPMLARGVDGDAAPKLAPLAMQIVRRAPVIELTTLRLGDGPAALNGRGRLAFDARGLGDEVPPGRLLTRLAGEFELDLPVALAAGWWWPRVAETDARLVPPPYDRLFASAPEGYRLRATLRRGRLLVNGEPWHGPVFSP